MVEGPLDFVWLSFRVSAFFTSLSFSTLDRRGWGEEWAIDGYCQADISFDFCDPIIFGFSFRSVALLESCFGANVAS